MIEELAETVAVWNFALLAGFGGAADFVLRLEADFAFAAVLGFVASLSGIKHVLSKICGQTAYVAVHNRVRRTQGQAIFVQCSIALGKLPCGYEHRGVLT